MIQYKFHSSYVILLFQFFPLCSHGIQFLTDIRTGIVFFVQQVLAKVFKSLECTVPSINFCTVFLSNTNYQDIKVTEIQSQSKHLDNYCISKILCYGLSSTCLGAYLMPVQECLSTGHILSKLI